MARCAIGSDPNIGGAGAFARIGTTGAGSKKLDGIDLAEADLSGTLWLDGKKTCAEASIGICR